MRKLLTVAVAMAAFALPGTAAAATGAGPTDATERHTLSIRPCQPPVHGGPNPCPPVICVGPPRNPGPFPPWCVPLFRCPWVPSSCIPSRELDAEGE
jgi:hypothetical protein